MNGCDVSLRTYWDLTTISTIFGHFEGHRRLCIAAETDCLDTDADIVPNEVGAAIIQG